MQSVVGLEDIVTKRLVDEVHLAIDDIEQASKCVVDVVIGQTRPCLIYLLIAGVFPTGVYCRCIVQLLNLEWVLCERDPNKDACVSYPVAAFQRADMLYHELVI